MLEKYSNTLKQNLAESLNNERFKLILLPTEKCNFRCLYCYESHNGPRMTMDTVNAIKLFLNYKIPRLKVFELEWFGGEPLLEIDIIIDITRYVSELCKRYGVKFQALMTTNGYFLDIDTFKLLHSLGITSYQITFDGDRANHNKFRLLPGKSEGSFDTLWNNISDISKTDLKFTITIRCHISSTNYDSVISFLQKVNNYYSEDTRFVCHLKEISPLGGENDDKLPYLDNEIKHNIIQEIKQQFHQLRFVEIQEGHICYASQPNCLMIRADGSIGKCTVALDSDLNKLGEINLNGFLDIDNYKFDLWIKGLKTLNKEYLECPYYEMRKQI